MAKFYENCPNCGIGEVEQEAFKGMFTGELKKRIEEVLLTGATTITANFDKKCPKCDSSGKEKVRIIATWPKRKTNLN